MFKCISPDGKSVESVESERDMERFKKIVRRGQS